MSTPANVSHTTTLTIRDTCLCLHVQRAARVLARRFDEALRPLGLTSGQFSMLNALNRPEPARMGAVSTLLGMDRTTLTAALKPLERGGYVKTDTDPQDKRGRVVALTAAGHALLASAVPVWKSTHADLDRQLGDDRPEELRQALGILSQ